MPRRRCEDGVAVANANSVDDKLGIYRHTRPIGAGLVWSPLTRLNLVSASDDERLTADVITRVLDIDGMVVDRILFDFIGLYTHTAIGTFTAEMR
jgi:hypothetical protein